MSTFTKLYAYASLLSLVGTQAFAANDWSVACTTVNTCSYDLPASSGASASVQVWGAPNTISDLTKAAGWTIVKCDPGAMNQTIQVVCTATGANATECDHVLQNGAKDKIVRLPENCGPMPFARVTNMVATNQSVPAAIKRELLARNATTPPVYSVTIDTNFQQANATHGEVSFAVQGLNIPGQDLSFPPATPAPARRYVSRPVMAMKHRRAGTGKVARKVNEFEQKMKKLNQEMRDKLEHPFNKTANSGPKPINVNVNKSLFSGSVDCPPHVTGQLQVGITAKSQATITIGATAVGTLVPAKLDDFDMFVALDGTLDGTLTAKATAQGVFTSPNIPLFTAPVPGLNVPGIFTLGPAFVINAEVTGDVNLALDVTTGINYKFSGVQFEFPPGTDSVNVGTYGPTDNAFTLSASPELTGGANVSAHVIPELTVGINVLNGLGEADVFLNLDANASLNISGIDLKASGTVGTAGKTGSAAAQACVDVSTGLTAHVGAKAALLHVFDKTTQLTLFDKNFDLFKKCFSGQTKTASTSSVIASTTKPAASAPAKTAASAASTTAAQNKAPKAATSAPAAPKAAAPKAAASKATVPAAHTSAAAVPAAPKVPAAAAPKASAAAPGKPATRTVARSSVPLSPLAKRAALKCSTLSAPGSLVSQIVHAVQQTVKA